MSIFSPQFSLLLFLISCALERYLIEVLYSKTRTTSQAPATQPALLAADYFTAGLGDPPPDDWSRTWASGRTIMLRRTSKRVKEVVDKMRLPAVVRLSRIFWRDTRNGTEKRQFVLRQLTGMSALCRITTLELRSCAIT